MTFHGYIKDIYQGFPKSFTVTLHGFQSHFLVFPPFKPSVSTVSGAIQYGVPTTRRLELSISLSFVATPKSASLMMPVLVLKTLAPCRKPNMRKGRPGEWKAANHSFDLDLLTTLNNLRVIIWGILRYGTSPSLVLRTFLSYLKNMTFNWNSIRGLEQNVI